MNRMLVPVLIALAAPVAHAQMTKVADASDRSFYMDPKAIEGTGNVVRVPVIEDYPAAQEGGVRSRRVMFQVDCGGTQLRAVSSTSYSQPMAAGTQVGSSDAPSDWLYVGTQTGSWIPPQTPFRAIWQAVCR